MCNKDDGYMRKLSEYKQVCFAVGNEASIEVDAYNERVLLGGKYVESHGKATRIESELRIMVGSGYYGQRRRNEKIKSQRNRTQVRLKSEKGNAPHQRPVLIG